MAYLYVLTDPDKIRVNTFKVGYHSGDYKQLIKRYSTSLPLVRVLFFQWFDNAKRLEADIKKTFEHTRQLNPNGNRSEWYECELHIIMAYIWQRQTGVKSAIDVYENILPIDERPLYPDLTEDMKKLKFTN